MGLFIIKVDIFLWSHRSHPVMLTTEPGVVIIFWEHVVQSLSNTRLFGIRSWNYT